MYASMWVLDETAAIVGARRVAYDGKPDEIVLGMSVVTVWLSLEQATSLAEELLRLLGEDRYADHAAPAGGAELGEHTFGATEGS